MAKQTRAQKSKGQSVLLSCLGGWIDRIYEALAQSMLARFLCSYQSLQSLAAESFVVRSVRSLTASIKKKLQKPPRRENSSEMFRHDEVGIFVPSSLHKSLKTRLSEAVEESVILRKANVFLRMMLLVPLISYGVFLFAFGLSTTVVQAVMFFAQGQVAGAAIDLFVGLALVLLSLPTMFKGYEPLLGCLQKSVLGSLVLRSLFGLEGQVKGQANANQANFFLFLFGVFFGCVTRLIEPMILILIGLLLIVAIGIVIVPEAGVLLIFTFFPFTSYLPHPSIVCGIAVLYVGGCWLLKAMLGKRSISFDFFDALVYALMLWILICGCAGGQVSGQSALLYLAMMASYPITANLLRSKLWFRRCTDGLILSSAVVSLIGFGQWIGGGAVRSVFSGTLVLGCYLVSVIPVTLSRMRSAFGRNQKFRCFLALVLQCGCIVVSGSRLAMLIGLIEVVGFALLASKKTVRVLVALALVTPFAALLLPLFPNLLPTLSMPISAGRQAASLELLELIGKAPLTGIGMSDSLFYYALPDGAVGVRPELSNTFLRLASQIGLPGLFLFLFICLVALMAGCSLISNGAVGRREKCYTKGAVIALVARLIMGGLCYLWADYRMLMLFWSLMGLYQAVRSYSNLHERNSAEEDVPSEDVQWVNVDLYFDRNGRQSGQDYRTSDSKTGGKKS